MDRLLLINSISLALAMAAFGQQAVTRAKSPELVEIERLESEWNSINEVSDADGKERLLADDSYHVGPSGRLYNKTQDIAAMRASRREKETSDRKLTFLMTGRRIRLYGRTAVVTATGQAVTTTQGEIRKGSLFRVIHVWEKRDGRWLLVVDQVTAVAH